MTEKDPDAGIWKTTRYPLGPSIIPKSEVLYSPVTLLEDLSTVQTETAPDGKRLYIIGDRKFPSITTVIKATDTEGQEALTKWRARLGPLTAGKITAAAAYAGTNWHAFAERWLTNVPYDWRYFTVPNSQRQASQLAALLNEKLETVIASEMPIVSNRLGVAGRMDIGAKRRSGPMCILDFKTGRKLKKANRLRQAAIQCCFYADALTEQMDFGVIDTVAVVQILPDAVYWQESPAEYWRPMLMDCINRFKAENA